MSPEAAVQMAEEEARRSVPATVRMLLRARGHREMDLARALGLSSGQMSERLSGKTRISSSELAGIARFLGVNPGLLYSTPESLVAAMGATLRPEVQHTPGLLKTPGSRVLVAV